MRGFNYAEDALEYMEKNSCDVAFLDVEMAGQNGVLLAQKLRERNPKINIVFATGYSRYQGDAYDMHASGYLLKPITPAKVKKELEDLRYPVAEHRKTIRVQAFGNFEVYQDGRPVAFRYGKTKELLAYLIDRNGALCTNGELMLALFEDDSDHNAYLRSLRQDLVDTLGGELLHQQRGKLAIVRSALECDYYDWLEGRCSDSVYHGEYMSQYHWASYTNENIRRVLNLERADTEETTET